MARTSYSGSFSTSHFCEQSLIPGARRWVSTSSITGVITYTGRKITACGGEEIMAEGYIWQKAVPSRAW